MTTTTAPTAPPASAAGPRPDADPRPLGLRLLLLLAFVAAASPLAIDLYLASFPAIQRDLATTPGMVQLTLTSYLIGISIGQPLWGPVSDRFGRRPTLLVSTAITLASSFLVVLAPTIEVLVAARFVQALSAASGMVIARAMIADLAQGYAGVRALALMMTIHGMTPVAAPAIGGVLATFVPWRGVLAVLTVVVAVQLVVTMLLVPETLPPEQRADRVHFGGLARVLARPGYVTYALTLGFAVATMMAYIGSASFVYQDVLGFTPLAFGITFTLNALGMVAGGLLSARLAHRQVHPPGPSGWHCPAPSSAACWWCARRSRPGRSAMLGLFMFGISALVIPVSGLVGGVDSAVPMAVVMTVMALCASTSFVVGRRAVARDPGSEAAFA